MSTPKSNLIQTKSFDFAVKILPYVASLQKAHQYSISDQLCRSATSIWANVEEAIGAESRADFLHKMSIAKKEARETVYWLRLISAGWLTSEQSTAELILEAIELLNILTKIVKTLAAQKN